MFIKQKPHPVEMAHTIFGLMFVGFAIFHISNNWGSLKTYSKDKVSRSWKKELLFALAGGLIILTLALTGALEPVAEFGRIFAPKRQGPGPIMFQEKKTLETAPGKAATLILQRKQSDMFTPLKVELADSTGKIVSTLFEDVKPAGEEAEEKRPMANLIIETKINTEAPFSIIVSTDKSKQETKITSSAAGIQSFSKSDQSPLQRGMIEFE
jgi:hypothetical protein